MHDSLSTVLARVARVVRDRLGPAERRTIGRLDVAAWELDHPDGEPLPIPAAMSRAQFAPVAIGTPWGPPWGTTWFRLSGTVDAPAGARVEAVVDLGWSTASPGFQAEGLVIRPDGSIVKGLNPLSQWIPIDGNGPLEFFVEAAANPVLFHRYERTFDVTPLGDKSTAGDERQYRLMRADITVVNEEVRALLVDLDTLGGLAAVLPESDARRWELLAALERALDTLDPDDPAGSAELARRELAGVAAAPARASAHHITAVGHAHIDSAWLWPVRETVRKVARTVSNVLQLMTEHPDLTFAMSSAQQWEWLRTSYPELFARLAERVAEGRVIPVGGMWVESDTVMVGGEAMVRQFVEGTAFFREHLSTRSRVVWLPDSFGYSGALPQIVRAAGFDAFLTQKISWSRTNRFPHHSFDWIGIDGTRVFTHFPPADTYNGEVVAAELAHAAANYREKGRGQSSLLPVGHGDGGGGPTREMIERARRVRSLDGSPTVEFGTPEGFFAAASAELAERPAWFGELYLELHRGTLTSQLAMKQGNRRSEHLLREAELWWATAATAVGADYPYDELREIWRTVLLHQFHDILPGSSIAWVHREARDTYARVARRLDELIRDAQAILSPDGPATFNARPFAVRGIPAGGAGPESPRIAAVVHRDGEETTLSAEGIAVRIDARGLVTSMVAGGREYVAPGEALGLLQLHDDKPIQWDAWDLDEHYRHRVRDLDAVDDIRIADEDGVGSVIVERSFGRSRVRQTFRIWGEAPGLHIETEVDWREREKVLKLALPLDVHADRAAFETQFGHVHRPIDANTSWDAARFEVCAHRWVHVGDGDGVAVVNDSTYGHETRRLERRGGGSAVLVRETLLRAPLYPDPHTDQGRHVLQHVVLPAAGVREAVEAGYALNLPLREVPAGTSVPPGTSVPVRAPLVAIEGSPGVLIEAVKLAQDRSGDIVVRLYEALGRPGEALLHIGVPAFAGAAGELRGWVVVETDLHEEPAAEASAWDGERLRMRPFQIVSLRLTRGPVKEV